MTFRGHATGLYLYLAVFVATVAWALWEAGLAFWPLVPRLIVPIFLAACALFVLPLVPTDKGRPASGRPFVLGGLVLTAGFAGFIALMFLPHNIIRNEVALVPGKTSPATAAVGDNWVSWGKTTEGLRYATIEQITPQNICNLKPPGSREPALSPISPSTCRIRTHHWRSMARYTSAPLDRKSRHWMASPERSNGSSIPKAPRHSGSAAVPWPISIRVPKTNAALASS